MRSICKWNERPRHNAVHKRVRLVTALRALFSRRSHGVLPGAAHDAFCTSKSAMGKVSPYFPGRTSPFVQVKMSQHVRCHGISGMAARSLSYWTSSSKGLFSWHLVVANLVSIPAAGGAKPRSVSTKVGMICALASLSALLPSPCPAQSPPWTNNFDGFAEYYESNYTPDHRGWRTRIAFKYIGPDGLSQPVNNMVALFASIAVGLRNVETTSNLVVHVFDRQSEQMLMQNSAPFLAAPIRNAKSVDEAIAAGRPCALFANVDDGVTTQAVVAVRAELTVRHQLSCIYQLIRESFGFKPLRQILDDNQRMIMFDQMAVYMISRK